VQPIRGVVQHYAWGDRTFIPRLLGLPPDGRPWAELWLGTHVNGPATLDNGTALADVTGPLPYLLKVLAAAAPLSLQAHPSAEVAQEGFAAGRYRDPYPKPELLVAITPFEALCGVRPGDATVALLDELGATDLSAAVRDDGALAALTALYRGGIDVAPVVDACRRSSRHEAVWVVRLAERYPGDPSVAVTLLLNLVRLLPGEAIQLGAGNLHAYLGGAGIELMNASDNVVRGGLTTKPVDVDDLLRVLDPTPLASPPMPVSTRYALAGTRISLVRLEGPATHVASGHDLAVTMAGATVHVGPDQALALPQGVTAFIATTD